MNDGSYLRIPQYAGQRTIYAVFSERSDFSAQIAVPTRACGRHNGGNTLIASRMRVGPAFYRHAEHFAAVKEGLLVFLNRSEEHTSELQSLMRISYAVFCLKKKNI